MPHKDPATAREYQRKYQREWVRRRREEFFSDKTCVRCGTTKGLELDHVDPSTKISSSIWSWREERRIAEIAKCQVLCHPCHRLKTMENNDNAHGERCNLAKLSEADVKFILLHRDFTNRQCADMFEVDITNIQKIRRGEIWKHIPRE